MILQYNELPEHESLNIFFLEYAGDESVNIKRQNYTMDKGTSG